MLKLGTQLTPSHVCCSVQPVVSVHPLALGSGSFWCSPRCRQRAHQDHQCRWSSWVLYCDDKKKCRVFFWGHGDLHGSDVFTVLSFYCAEGFKLSCLLNWHDYLYITTASYRTQEKVAVNAPQIRSAAISVCFNFRSVCISKNEIFGILPQLKFEVPGDFAPIRQHTRRERTLVTASVRGPSAGKKKNEAFRARSFSVENGHPLRGAYRRYRSNAFFK